MADDDNFDIDIYGDDSYQDPNAQQDPADTLTDAPAPNADANGGAHSDSATNNQNNGDQKMKEGPSDTTNGDAQHDQSTQQIASTGGSTGNHEVHKQAPQKQGTKRKQGEDDDRPTDPGATAALMINDVNWWVSEEDIRGWANQSGCEDELNEVTFNEHKVNGKSKGYVFLCRPSTSHVNGYVVKSMFNCNLHKPQLLSSTRSRISSRTKHMSRSRPQSSTPHSTIPSRPYRRTFLHETRAVATVAHLAVTVVSQAATITIAAITTEGTSTTTEAETWATRTTATSPGMLMATWEEAWDTAVREPWLITTAATQWEATWEALMEASTVAV